MRNTFCGLVVCSALSASPLLAQELAPTATLRAVRMELGESISMDGRLDEPVWSRAVPADGFTQSDPRNGAAATEQSQIRIVFDAGHLYIGAELSDSEPTRLMGNQMIRDGALNADDRLMWTIDPLANQRSGYFFEVNPAGAMGDAQLVPAQGGSNDRTTQNRAWDGIWTARVRRHDRGWTVEVDIPFRTINFDPSLEAWGVNFQRTVRRKEEESLWTGWARNSGLFNLATGGRLVGISGVSQGRGIDLKPYVLGSVAEVAGRAATGTGDLGLDVGYSVTPQLKANVTINTDFAQTEVDDRQVNLTRFPLFFPEKRDFFLEGSGQFDVGRERPQILTPFFSRRVGLSERGLPQKIDYGIKLTGQTAGLNIGLLQVQTGQQGDSAGETFTVVRPRRLFLQESSIGMIYTRRTDRAGVVPNRTTIGADLFLSTSRFRASKTLQAGAYYLKTLNALKPGDDTAWGVRLDYPNDRWNIQNAYRAYRRNFDPAVGFVERTDFTKWFNVTQFRPRPKNSRLIRQLVFGVRTEVFGEFTGEMSDLIFNLTPITVNFQSGDTVNVLVTPSYEKLDRDFMVAPGIVLLRGTEHRYTRLLIEGTTANRRMISGSASMTTGSFYTGERRDLAGTLNVRPRPGLLATVSATFSRVEMPEGTVHARTLRALLNTQFGPWVSIANNVQFDSASKVLGLQSRFRWIMRPGNDIFIVWLNNWLDEGERYTTLNRNVVTKIVYTHRL
jgi:hypothetical protein